MLSVHSGRYGERSHLRVAGPAVQAGPVLSSIPGQRRRYTCLADVASGVSPGGHRRGGRRQTGACSPKFIPKNVSLGGDVGGGGID